ncbi:unnamed protein product [Effrenium voratum]|nr:unnamed protein product [Effrenium voratum]
MMPRRAQAVLVSVITEKESGQLLLDALEGFDVEYLTAHSIDRALTELSAMSNQVEHLVSVQDLPESNEELVADVRQLQKYQQIERFLAEVLLRILWKMKSQQRDDLGGLIREESLRRWATMQVPFVEAQEPQALSSLGRALQRLLVPIASKAGITGAPATTRAWTQLELILEACYRGEHLPKERCLAKHIHVTKSSFGKRGVGILQSIYHAQIECRQPPTVQHFSDSEDDGDAECKDPGVPRRSFVSQAKSDKAFVDTHMDRDPQAGSMLFERQVGFGRPLSSRNGVMTFYDEDLPLYYIQLDRQRLKFDYSSSDGLGLGYLVHKNVLAELLEESMLCRGSLMCAKDFPDRTPAGAMAAWGRVEPVRGNGLVLLLVRSLRMKFLPWIADVLRSPLPSDTKTWILRCCSLAEPEGVRLSMLLDMPSMNSTLDKGRAIVPLNRVDAVLSSAKEERSQVNLAIMAFSLCRCCPAGSDAALFLRSVLMNAWHVPEEVKRFAERKSDVYGIYIVKPGTLQRMQELGLRVVVRDFEREVWQRSMDNSSMYLDIISQFSSYCCFTYVKGLSKLDDILLKWLAEYTRLHPWRFVYIEGVDTTFNFPENRDRCNFRFAPANPLHSVKATEDLQKSNVTLARPSHTVSYDPAMQPSPEDLQDGRRLLSFFAKNLAPDSSTGSHADDAMHQETMFSQPPRASCYSADFRGELEELLFGAASCLVLLVSAPGAGKSHHMSALRGRLQEEMQFDIHEFDGSSDILVTTALAEALTEAAGGSLRLSLIAELDLAHLQDVAQEGLSALAAAGKALRDAANSEKDVVGVDPTASSAGHDSKMVDSMLRTVMDARGNSEKWRPAVCDWLVASRLLFGEEAVSLRLCDTLEAILQKLEPRASLIELLLHRVPTVSRTSASDFVDAYLQHQGLRRKAATQSLVSFCFRVALQDLSDELCSFVEFLSLTPRAHEAPPAVRLLAWACYVMNAKKWDLSGLSSVWSKRHLFVDQVSFPFELSEEALGSPSNSGPTFSWAGDPTSLRDLVDAVRRGHSVDWADVHRKVWSVEHIKDSELFAQLLSLSRTPSVILQQVLASNLCSLLRLSNTAAPTAVQLARIILQHALGRPSGSGADLRQLSIYPELRTVRGF